MAIKVVTRSDFGGGSFLVDAKETFQESDGTLHLTVPDESADMPRIVASFAAGMWVCAVLIPDEYEPDPPLLRTRPRPSDGPAASRE